MNWDAISSISDLVGAVAVVASLVFVGIQLKSNTKALRLSSTNTVVEQFTDGLARLSENIEQAELLYKGVPAPETLEGVDAYRFSLQIQVYMLNYANFYFQYKSGAMDDDIFTSLDSQMRNFCNTPGLTAYWRKSGGNYPASFRKYIEESVLGNFDPLWSLPGAERENSHGEFENEKSA